METMRVSVFTKVLDRLVNEFVDKIHKHDVVYHKHDIEYTESLKDYYGSFDRVTADQVCIDLTNDGLSLYIDDLPSSSGDTILAITSVESVTEDAHVGLILSVQ